VGEGDGAATRPAVPARAPRWTPPIPPVAKTEIPAAWAAIIVAETVVAAQPPPASAAARLGRAALRTEPAEDVARAVRAYSSRPTRMRPALIATVAGIAPAARTAASDASATSMFCGYGRPWLISVDSRATTAPPSARAAETSGMITRRSRRVVWFRTAEAYSRKITRAATPPAASTAVASLPDDPPRRRVGATPGESARRPSPRTSRPGTRRRRRRRHRWCRPRRHVPWRPRNA